MTHQRTPLQSTIHIEQLITLYYFEFGKEYVYKGEKHDFWEFLYVDKGEVEVAADGERYNLQQGMVIFHKPNEFHSFRANRITAPNLIVMTFDCHSPDMKHFENQIMVLNDAERNLLASIIEEGTNAFTFPFRYPLRDHRKSNVMVGSEQLIQLYLETFLIFLLRRITVPHPRAELFSAMKKKDDDILIQHVIAYLEQNMTRKITLSEISETLHVSRSRLKELFKKSTGRTIMEYFTHIKIKKAKELIREVPNNFTEIAAMTGFSSIHHFSKAFKKETGMSPSEYTKSIKGRVKRVI